MKRLTAFCVMILCMTAAAWAVASDDAAFELPSNRDGVEEFMAAFGLTCPNGVVDGYEATADKCYNVTPVEVARQTDIRVFKFSDSAASYAYVEGAAYDLCESFGGYGFLNAVPWDYDQDGKMDLLTASSWGSGIHRTEISVFNRAKKVSEVIYTTLYEADPQVDLMVVLADGGRGVSLQEVRLLDGEDGDSARMRYRVVGEYQPSLSMPLHGPKWDADAAAPLLGTWYCEIEEYSIRTGISMSFAADGTATSRLIDPVKGQYEEEGTGQYWVDGECLSLKSERETVTIPFTFTEEGLKLDFYGAESTTFKKLSGEELNRLASLQPKYRPGDTSRAVIDHGSSEHFTHEQMDAAIAVIKDRFLTWYGCEMHSISYTTDERSAGEYRYYAGPERRKTGKNYVDGIVFVSSFHTPPEGQGAPYSGLDDDDEYTGWEWILLLSESGEWELVTWGY